MSQTLRGVAEWTAIICIELLLWVILLFSLGRTQLAVVVAGLVTAHIGAFVGVWLEAYGHVSVEVADSE